MVEPVNWQLTGHFEYENHLFERQLAPPLPSSWHRVVRARCSCPAFVGASCPDFSPASNASCWCKHIASGFCVLAAVCDNDQSFGFLVSGHDIRAMANAVDLTQDKSIVDLTQDD